MYASEIETIYKKQKRKLFCASSIFDTQKQKQQNDYI